MRDLPEYQLVVSVLKAALMDATEKRQGPASRDAREWILSDSKVCFSFEWCCDTLGISPESVRAVIGTNRLRRGLRTKRVYPGWEAA